MCSVRLDERGGSQANQTVVYDKKGDLPKTGKPDGSRGAAAGGFDERNRRRFLDEDHSNEVQQADSRYGDPHGIHGEV